MQFSETGNNKKWSLITVLILVLCTVSMLGAQNRVLVVTSGPDMIEGQYRIDSICSEISFFADHVFSFPAELDVFDYSVVVLNNYDDSNCAVIEDYLSRGGCLILTGPAPNDLMMKCGTSVDVRAWFGFDYYINASGELTASMNLEQIGIEQDSLLDRTPCGYSFGALAYPREGSEILAEWICPLDGHKGAAITHNEFSDANVFYFSRPLSAIRSRAMFAWALDNGVEYRWGDVDLSGAVNITDAVYLIKYIFEHGNAPQMVNAADANGDGMINVSDASFIIGYIFQGGDPPRAGRVE